MDGAIVYHWPVEGYIHIGIVQGMFFLCPTIQNRHMTFGSKLLVAADQHHFKNQFYKASTVADVRGHRGLIENGKKLYQYPFKKTRYGVGYNNTFCADINKDNSIDNIPNPPDYYYDWSREQREKYCRCVVESSDVIFSSSGDDTFITGHTTSGGDTIVQIAYDNFPMVKRCAETVGP